ncbi:hypothetical protein CVV26_03325 [Candidatus Kuenenbacteria bacterium HGW-Kuenenbacteria-1]|uniref:Uncharacterized protein n=1 Tax=Candidatus Kuenenbacteria bacterium HGW-Kuenenbacteria-1 TaxID=2013812 RepID=A0A2N1UMQ6_9BACT|nr:MAG: hypothetical protein CVV26_03325 [Candidatus Kuenenbacteria bacterium HGW-Kuenenbacteria-1]
MSNRTKIIILISVGTIIVIVLLFAVKNIYEQNFSKKKLTETTLIVEPKATKETIIPSKIPLLTEEIKAKIDLEKIAFNFIESLGSYSNQSDFQNMIGLKVFATSKMQDWIDNFIKQEKAKIKSINIYYGITTKALAIKKNNFNTEKNQTELLINTQRQEAKESTQNIKTYYQDILVKLVKEGDDWKIDGVEWKKNL